MKLSENTKCRLSAWFNRLIGYKGAEEPFIVERRFEVQTVRTTSFIERGTFHDFREHIQKGMARDLGLKLLELGLAVPREVSGAKQYEEFLQGRLPDRLELELSVKVLIPKKE